MGSAPLSQAHGQPIGALGLSIALHAAALLAAIFSAARPLPRTTPVEESVALVFQAPAPSAPTATELVPVTQPEPTPAVPADEPAPSAQPEEQAIKPTPPLTKVVRLPAQVWLPPPKQIAHAAPLPQRTPEPPTAQPPQAIPAVASAATETVVPPRPVAGMQANHPPNYPELARRRGEQGRVMLRVSVSTDGTPLEVDVQSTSGYPVLDTAAQAAVRQWRFVPAMQGGAPVRAIAEIPVRFQLEN